MLRTLFQRSALALAIPASLLATGDVHVVDATGGGDFTQLQAAANAAQDGDTLLVKQGTYGPLNVDGKALTVAADQGHIVSVLGGVGVQNTGTDQEVVLINLRSLGLHGTGSPHGLRVISADGQVRVEGCVFKAADGSGSSGNSSFGGDGAFLSASGAVAMSGCGLIGGDGGGDLDGSGYPQRAGHGLRMEGGSLAALYECTSQAGDAMEFDLTTCDYGGQQGHGAWALGSVLFASGSSFRGGRGGSEGLCGVSFPGGDGVRVDGPAAHADLLDVTLTGGPSNSCGSLRGQRLALVNGGTASTLGGPARSMTCSGPIRAGAATTLGFKGSPGDRIFLLLGQRAGWTDTILTLHSPLLVRPPASACYVGMLGPAGTLQRQLPAPLALAGEDSDLRFLQAVFLDVSGAARAGSHATLLVLDPSF